MRSLDVITLDLETSEIKPRPDYPPVPVGCAIHAKGEKTRYLSWGHPSKNNTTKAQAKKELMRLWLDPRPKLFHHSKFDYDVLTTHMGMPELDWSQIHDTLFLVFLQNPDRSTLALKPVAEQVLGLPPNERDDVRQWLLDNKVIRKNDRKWGRFIDAVPGNLVGKYAIGDVTRTRKLFDKYYQEIINRGMGEAYDRERALMPMLLESERRGVRVDLTNLGHDVSHYHVGLERIDDWIRKRLKAPSDLNVDADEELGEAIQKAKMADLTKWVRTESGKQYSMAKGALAEAITDAPLAAALAYRAPLATCLRTFMDPWLVVAQRTGGLIYTTWNQVRQDYYTGTDKGARTSRLSSTPNFQNIPTGRNIKGIVFDAISKFPALKKLLDEYPIPKVRSYLLPNKGKAWIKTDVSQQELRILAHYEDGTLLDAYKKNPNLDMHVFVQKAVSGLLNIEISRDPIKTLNFGIIYGQGTKRTAEGMGVAFDLASRIQLAHSELFPSIAKLKKDLKNFAKQNLPIRTWGGREYYCEAPREIKKGPRKGQMQSFEYKLLNRLIQGSAADHTKQAIINYYNDNKRNGDFLVQVHDELNVEVDNRKNLIRQEAKTVQQAFANVNFDVPMLSESSWGYSYGTADRKT